MRFYDLKYWLKHLALDCARGYGHGAAAARASLADRVSRPPFGARSGAFTPSDGWGGAGARGRSKAAVLLTPCCWYPFTSPIVQLTLSLERLGFEFDFASGNGGACGFWPADGDWSAARCDETFEYLKREILPARASFRRLNALVTPEIEEAGRAYVEAHAAEEVEALELEGLNLWRAIRTSAARREREARSPEGKTLAESGALRELVAGVAVNYEVMKRWLTLCAPDALLIFSGFSYQEALAAHAARGLGIRVVAHENAPFRNRRIFDSTGRIGNATSAAGATWQRVCARTLSAKQERALDRFFKPVFAGVTNTIAQAPGGPAEAELRAALGLAPGQPAALLLGQVPYDSVMVEDNPFFKTSLDFIRTVIEIFRRWPQRALIVRLHPAEERDGDPTLRALSGLPLPPNARLVHGRQFNTYDLMRIAECGVTATSQAGLEMLWLGKPLVTAGRAFYAGKGFTFDLTEKTRLDEMIAVAMDAGRLSAEARRRARSFLYHVVFEHQMPYDADYLRFPPRSVDRVAALLRGRDFIDWDGI